MKSFFPTCIYQRNQHQEPFTLLNWHILNRTMAGFTIYLLLRSIENRRHGFRRHGIQNMNCEVLEKIRCIIKCKFKT